MKKHLTKRRVACYLLYFTMACTLVTGVTYARFTTTVAGTGAAQVAAVEMNTTLDLSDKLQGLTPGGADRVITFTVNNAKNGTVSQVTQAYAVTVQTTGNLPLTYSLAGTVTRGGGKVTADATAGSGTWTWSGGELPHTDETVHTYTLTVSWPGDQSSGYAGEIDLVTLTVDAEQVNPSA